jgi:tripartite-type tricarboxylate transporter receptor subunit TctC
MAGTGREETMVKLGRRQLAAAAGAALALPARAQGGWPERNVTFVVCFPPGGSTDTAARLVAQGVGEVLGRNVVVENRGGAGGNIGIGAVARSAPDGYTLLVASSVFVVNASLYRNAPYDPFRDFAPVALLGSSPNVCAVRAELGIGSFAQLVQRVRAEPDKFNCALPGIGTTPHLAAEVLKLRAGMPLQLVPFAGAGPAVQSILSGAVQVLIASQGGQVETATKSGSLKLLLQTGAVRNPDMAEVPTARELGLADAESETFNALYAPAGTPPAVVEKLAAAVRQVMRAPGMAQRFRAAGLTPLDGGPEALGARVREEVPKWRQVIQQAKIVVE